MLTSTCSTADGMHALSESVMLKLSVNSQRNVASKDQAANVKLKKQAEANLHVQDATKF